MTKTTSAPSWMRNFKRAREQNQAAPNGDELPGEATLLAEFRADNGGSPAEMSRKQPLLVVLLRHARCTFRREVLADLEARRAGIERSGARMAPLYPG